MKVLTLFLLGILFTSCMHMGMPMMENGHQGHQTEPVLEKEISSGDVKAVATFPPMQAGREEVFTLKLTNKVSREPVTGAQVYFHVALLPHDESTTHSGTSPHDEATDDVDGARDATQSPDDPGVYTVTYGSPEVDQRAEKVGGVKVSDDRRRVALAVTSFKPGRVYELRLDGVKSADGDAILHPEAYYTLNEIP